jgi:hypothetical protein
MSEPGANAGEGWMDSGGMSRDGEQQVGRVKEDREFLGSEKRRFPRAGRS